MRKNLQEKTGEPNIIRNVEALYTVNAKENEKNLVNYSIKDEIKEQLKIHFPNQEARHQAMAEQIEETFNYMHLLSIFDLDHTKYTAGREIDGAILYSVLKAKGGRETDKEMLKNKSFHSLGNRVPSIRGQTISSITRATGSPLL